MLKKASIPITLFVILVVLLLVFTLVAFSLSSGKSRQIIDRGYLNVQNLNAKILNKDFVGDSSEIGPAREFSQKYWFVGESKLEVSVISSR